MNHRSDNGAAAVVLAVVVLLLLVAAGSGIYFFVARQRAALAAEADLARVAEAKLIRQVEVARAETEKTDTARTSRQETASPTGADDAIRGAVESVLREQEAAWNRGDLDAFMDHYWKSDALTFSSGGATTRGWTETLNRYRERYPTPEQMGRLALSELEITPLGDGAALVLGRWNVERADEPLAGNFSLVVRKIDEHWLIIHDHTSRKED